MSARVWSGMAGNIEGGDRERPRTMTVMYTTSVQHQKACMMTLFHEVISDKKNFIITT